MVKKQIETHSFFNRRHRVFDRVQESIDHFPIVIPNGHRISSPSPLLLVLQRLPPVGCLRGIYFYSRFNILQPTEEDVEHGAVPAHRTL